MLAGTKDTTRCDREELLNFDDDTLLDGLTEDEINQLEDFLNDLDPENNSLPARDRTRYHVNKPPTENFNRESLLDFLDKQAAEAKSRDDYVPYTGEKKGKVWRPKQEVRRYEIKKDTDKKGELGMDPDWEAALEEATEDDIVDLAAILGMHEMVNQEQFYAARSLTSDKLGKRSFNTVCKFSIPAALPKEPPVDIDVEKIISQVKDNDSSLTNINFTNFKVSREQYSRLADALKSNTSVKELLLSNTGMDDCIGFAFADMLEENETIEVLNLETNYLTGHSIMRLCDAIEENKTLKEFRITNQFSSLGQKYEMRLADMIEANHTILKLGHNFKLQGPLMRTMIAVKRNVELDRRVKRGEAEESEKAPTPKPRNEFDIQESDKQKQYFAEMRTNLIEMDKKKKDRKLEPLQKVKPRKPVFVSPQDILNQLKDDDDEDDDSQSGGIPSLDVTSEASDAELDRNNDDLKDDKEDNEDGEEDDDDEDDDDDDADDDSDSDDQGGNQSKLYLKEASSQSNDHFQKTTYSNLEFDASECYDFET